MPSGEPGLATDGTAGEVPRGSWTFGDIPLLPSDAAGPPKPPVSAARNPQAVPARLVVRDGDDPLEREAEQVAERVTQAATPNPAVATAGRPGPLAVAGRLAPADVHEVLRSPGMRLDGPTRAFFEPRFGRDFSAVRVHADDHAARSAASIDAQAYAAGDHIVFGAGQLAPTPEGRRLLAHELSHVVQQGGALQAVQRSPAAPPKTQASSFNSYIDLFNGFQDLAAAAINRGGAGLDSARFGPDLSRPHRALLSRVRTVLIQAQGEREERRAAAAAWPDLAAKLQTAVAEATRLSYSGEALAAVTDAIAMLGRSYVHAKAGKSEPEAESFGDYADSVSGMNDLLWEFGHMGEAGEGLIREEVPNRKETAVSSAVHEANAKQRAALGKVVFGGRLNARHAKVLDTLRTALLLARSEAPGSAYKALVLWRSIEGDLRHVLARAPGYKVQFDVDGIRAEVDSAAKVLADHYAAVHRDNVGVALTQPRAPEQVKVERAVAKAAGPVVAASMHEAHAVEDFRYALTIIEQHLVPSKGRPGEWTLTSGDTVIRVREDQVQALRAVVAKELKDYMAQLVKAMVRVWDTYDAIQRGNSDFKLNTLSVLGGATDPGDQSHYKDSLIRIRDETVYPLVDQGRYVEAFSWIITQKGVVDRQAEEVGDYDSDLDLGYARLATAAQVVQVALVALVPVAGEAAIVGGASALAVGGTAVAAGGIGAGAAETGRELAAGEDLDLGRIAKTTYSGALIGASAVGPAATRGLGRLIMPEAVGTAAVGTNALASGVVGATQSRLGGGDGLEGFAGGFVGSLAGSATAQVLGPIAENPAVNTVISGGIGAGTAALTGGDPLAGAVGGISGALGHSALPNQGSSRPPVPLDAAEQPVAAAPKPPAPPVSEPVIPAAAAPAEPAGVPPPAPSQLVPLRSSYTPPDETMGMGRPDRGRGRARPFYAKDPLSRPGAAQPVKSRSSKGKPASSQSAEAQADLQRRVARIEETPLPDRTAREAVTQTLKRARTLARTNLPKAQELMDHLEAELASPRAILDPATRAVLAGEERTPDEGFEEASRILTPDDIRAFSRSQRPLPTAQEVSLMQQVVDEVSTRLMMDPDEAVTYLSPGERAAAEGSQGLTAAQFGNAVERAVAAELSDRPELARFLHTPQRPFVSTPDIARPIGPRGSRNADVTTNAPRAITAHQARSYAPFTRLVTYPSLPPGWRFPPLD